MPKICFHQGSMVRRWRPELGERNCLRTQDPVEPTWPVWSCHAPRASPGHTSQVSPATCSSAFWEVSCPTRAAHVALASVGEITIGHTHHPPRATASALGDAGWWQPWSLSERREFTLKHATLFRSPCAVHFLRTRKRKRISCQAGARFVEKI